LAEQLTSVLPCQHFAIYVIHDFPIPDKAEAPDSRDRAAFRMAAPDPAGITVANQRSELYSALLRRMAKKMGRDVRRGPLIELLENE
jgi:hypothetical protein